MNKVNSKKQAMKITPFVMMCVCFMFSSTSYSQVPSDVGLELVGSVGNNVGVRHAGDGSNRLFVINQNGIIRIFDDQDNLLPTPFLDISSRVTCCGERGLLGLAFHPDYSNNGFFFVNYSKSGTNSGDTIIERYQVSADPNVADAGSGQVLMRIIQDFSNHNGGNIAFGPDGYLYIGMGDGGSGGDPENRAQVLASNLGKMLRIDVDNDNAPNHPAPANFEADSCPQDTGNYAIPADNPFVTTPAGSCPEIWAYGLRNPWRFSFDKDTGDLFIGDVGQNAKEEIDFQPANSTGGENYGWKCREADQNFSGCTGTFVEPILVKNHSQSRCSITGGYMYRGPVNSIQGNYIYGDYCSGQVFFAQDSGTSWTEDLWSIPAGISFAFNLTSFGEDEAGNIYISKQSGDFYRITGDVTMDDLIFASGFEN